MLIETDLFAHIEVLRGLPIEQQDFLGRYSQSKSYGKNAFIYQPGEPSDWIYFVVDGVVKNGTVNKEGREVIKNLFFGSRSGATRNNLDSHCVVAGFIALRVLSSNSTQFR
jgi:CRP-like cAMP-binding protein